MNGRSAKIFGTAVRIALLAQLPNLYNALVQKCFQGGIGNACVLFDFGCGHRQVALQNGRERLFLCLGGQFYIVYGVAVDECIGIFGWNCHLPNALDFFALGFLENALLFGNTQHTQMLEFELNPCPKAAAQSIERNFSVFAQILIYEQIRRWYVVGAGRYRILG